MPYRNLARILETGQIKARIETMEERLDEYGPLLLVDWFQAH